MATSHASVPAVGLASLKLACRNCGVRELCLPVGLNESEMRRFEDAIEHRRAAKKGEVLYHQGEPMRRLYVVRRGTFKTSGVTEDGRINVTGFFLPGEFLGFDAIATDRHPCTAEALENGDVCEIPYGGLEELARQLPELQRRLLKIMSREIERDERLLLMLGRMSAEGRLASFLLSFSYRQAQLGLSGTDINLPMSRQDLGLYLGLALETVSRLFSRFQAEGLIETIGHQVRLRDLARLNATIDGSCR